MVSVHSLYDAIVDEKGNGDYLLPSAAFAGGAINVFVRRGIYLEVADVVIPDGGELTGESQGKTIIDFQNGAFCVRGSFATTPTINSTGTIALVKGTNTVVGTGTDFTSPALNPGDWLSIHSNTYEIKSITDATNLTLVQNYNGKSQSGLSFKANAMTSYNKVQNLTVRNSAMEGLLLIACRRLKVESVTVENCNSNFSLDNATESSLINCSSDSSQDVGILFNSCESMTCGMSFTTNSLSHGFMTTGECHDLLLSDIESSSNGDNGFYLSGNFRDSCVTKCVGKNNYAHGINIDNMANSFVLTGCSFSRNGGNGILSSGTAGLFTENVCDGNTETGVELIGDLCLAIANMIRNNLNGITVAGYANIIVSTAAIDSAIDCCHLKSTADYPIVSCCNLGGAGLNMLNSEATNAQTPFCIP